PPGYYFRPGSGAGKDSWHVFLPFGGWCTTPGECKWRATQIHYGSTKPALQATNPFNNALQGYRGILSTNKTDNPRFYNWNLVMPVYCDGGGFAGRAGFKNVSGSEGVYLLGWNIIKAVLTDVTDRRGLKTASQVLLSGVSAGAEAVVTLCDQLPALVPSAKTTKCLMDSGFFLGEKFASHSCIALPSLQPPSASWTRDSSSVSLTLSNLLSWITLASLPPPSASWIRASSLVSPPSCTPFSWITLFRPFNSRVPKGLGLLPTASLSLHKPYFPDSSATKYLIMGSRSSVVCPNSLQLFFPPLPSTSWTLASFLVGSFSHTPPHA
ncbi:unnamed protein product, partial [Closterium sp. NIES-53]